MREMAESNQASDTETTERKGADTAESKGVDTLKQESAPQYLEGGYGWVIVIGSFLQNAVVDGMMLSFGVLYTEFVKIFESSSAEATWVLSLQVAIHCAIGPIVSALLLTFGARVVVMSGSIILTVGIIASAYVPDILYLYLTFGVINGIGMGLLYQTSCVLSSYYFNKRRGLVNGVVSCGTGVGLMVFPLFLSYVLELMGLIGTFYILAGVALQLMICGAAIIPAEKLMRPKLMKDSEKGDKGLKSIGDGEQEEMKTKKSFFDHMRNIKKNSMELKLFYKPSFCLFTLSAVLWRFAYFTPMVFLPSRAISFGHSSEATAPLLTLSGAASILGRVVYGLLADVQRLRQFRQQLFASAFIFAGLVSVVNFGEEYHHQILYAMLYGAFLGGTFGLRTTVLADLIGMDHLPQGFGMVSMLEAVIMMVGPISAAWLYDWSQDYGVVYLYAGCVLIASGLVILLIPLASTIQRLLQSRSTQRKTQTESAGNSAYIDDEKL